MSLSAEQQRPDSNALKLATGIVASFVACGGTVYLCDDTAEYALTSPSACAVASSEGADRVEVSAPNSAVVASSSTFKLQAVQNGFGLVASNVSAFPTGGAFPAAEQPIDMETDRLCAARLQHVVNAATASKKKCRIVAIESGLFHVGGESAMEVAVVKVFSPQDGRAFTGYAGAKLPLEAKVGHRGETIASLLKQVTPEVTLGSLIHREDENLAADNWHEAILGESRQAQIARALAMAEKKRQLYHTMGLYPDFPKAPVLFQDVGDIYEDADSLNSLVDVMANDVAVLFPTANKLLMLESRGFPLAAALQQRLRSMGQTTSLVQARKPNKLPGKLVKETYEKEYGRDTMAVQEHMLKRGDQVLLIDDIVATGGTLTACETLVKRSTGGAATLLGSVVINQVDPLAHMWKMEKVPYVALK